MVPVKGAQSLVVFWLNQIAILKALKQLTQQTFGQSAPGTKSVRFGVLYGEVCRKFNDEGYIVTLATNINQYDVPRATIRVTFNKDFRLTKRIEVYGTIPQWRDLIVDNIPLI